MDKEQKEIPQSGAFSRAWCQKVAISQLVSLLIAPMPEDDVVDDHADGEYAEGESFEEV